MSPDIKNVFLDQKTIDTTPTEGSKITKVNVHRSKLVELGEKHTWQMAAFVVDEKSEQSFVGHMGYSNLSAPLRHLFENFGQPNIVSLGVSWGVDSKPKVGKEKTGDMSIIAMSVERYGTGRKLFFLTMVVDNLSTNREFLSKTDGEASKIEKESFLSSPNEFYKFSKHTSSLKAKKGIYGPAYPNNAIPQDVLEFRNSLLSLVCSNLPHSEKGSELYKGVYAANATTVHIDSFGQFSGSSVSIRSLADLDIKVWRNMQRPLTDDHRAAYLAGKAAGMNSAENYSARLNAGLYDTVSSDYKQEIGGFEIFRSKIIKKVHGWEELSFGVEIRSDGWKVGNEVDDVSRAFVYVNGLPK